MFRVLSLTFLSPAAGLHEPPASTMEGTCELLPIFLILLPITYWKALTLDCPSMARSPLWGARPVVTVSLLQRSCVYSKAYNTLLRKVCWVVVDSVSCEQPLHRHCKHAPRQPCLGCSSSLTVLSSSLYIHLRVMFTGEAMRNVNDRSREFVYR